MFIFTLKIGERIANLTNIFFTWVETQPPTSYEIFDLMDDNEMNPYESIHYPNIEYKPVGCIGMYLGIFACFSLSKQFSGNEL